MILSEGGAESMILSVPVGRVITLPVAVMKKQQSEIVSIAN